MKRIITCFLIFGLFFAGTGCSKSKSTDDINAFFDAFDNTLKADSGHITGQMNMETEKNPYGMSLDCYFQQIDQPLVAAKVGLQADDQRQDDYLEFYIKDGKTYLNNLGTKSQSLAENIGITPDTKLNIFNPFLSFTDDELAQFFKSTKKEGSHYTYEIDPTLLSSLLDSLGTVTVKNAQLQCDIKDECLEDLDLVISGIQKLDKDSFEFTMTIQLNVEQLNSLESVPFPDDLDSYPVSEV